MSSRGPSLLTSLVGLAGVLGLAAAVFVLLRTEGPADPAPAPVVVAPAAAPDAGSVTPDLPTALPDARPDPPEATSTATASIEGRLVDVHRVAVEDGTVEVLVGAPSPLMPGGPLERVAAPVPVGDGGRFRIDGLPPRSDIVLRIDGDTFVLDDAGPYATRANAVTDAGDLIVDRGLTIEGAVYGPLGEEVAGAQVALGSGAGGDQFVPDRSRPTRVVLTDDSGRFVMAGVPRFLFVLGVSAKGYGNRVVSGGPTPEGGSSVIEMSIRLDLAAELAGRVVAAEGGDPLRGVTVVARGSGKRPGNAVAVTDEDGRFVFTDLAQGPYTLSADPEGYSFRKVTVVAKRYAEEVELRLAEAGFIRGRVVTPEGEPVTRFDLRVRYSTARDSPGGPMGKALRVRDGQGAFQIDDLAPGWYVFEVWSKGYAVTSTESVKLRVGRPLQGISITMELAAALRGTVVDDLGDPVAGARVSTHLNESSPNEFLRGLLTRQVWQRETFTDPDGVFEMTDLKALVVQVEVDHPDYPVVLVDHQDVKVGAVLEMEPVVLPRPATIEGFVTDETGQTMSRTEVSLGGTNMVNRSTRSDADGRFRFDRLPPGRYHLQATKPGAGFAAMFSAQLEHQQHAVPIDVKPGEVRSANVVAGG